MTVRSSEVLRLAAEYAFNGDKMPLLRATADSGWKNNNENGLELLNYALLCEFENANSGEEKSMALCLAAAIAKSDRN